jgi:hypothetical protein
LGTMVRECLVLELMITTAHTMVQQQSLCAVCGHNECEGTVVLCNFLSIPDTLHFCMSNSSPTTLADMVG